jgi:predicted ArsR family transcriptional regulator
LGVVAISASDQGPPLGAIARIVDSWSLDMFSHWYRFSDGDIRKADVCLFVIIANIDHLLTDGLLVTQLRNVPIAPADYRPVKISAITAALGLDDDTVRRKIAALRAEGRCLVTNRGVTIPMDDAGAAAFAAMPGGLPARMALLAARLRTLILDNGYDAAAIADLRAALDLDFERLFSARTLVNLLIGRHMARILAASTALFGKDRDSGAIYFTIYVESERTMAHDPQSSRADAWIDSSELAGASEPVTVRAIAEALGLPFETVRRKANRLIDKQLIQRVPGGLLLVRTPGVAALHFPLVYQQLLELLAQMAIIVAADAAGADTP